MEKDWRHWESELERKICLVLGRHNWRAESPEVPHNTTDNVRLYIYENDSGYSYDKGFPLPKRLGEKTVSKTVEKFESWFVKARNAYDKHKKEEEKE